MKKFENTPFEKLMRFFSICTTYVSGMLGVICFWLMVMAAFEGLFKGAVVYGSACVFFAWFTVSLIKSIVREDDKPAARNKDDDDGQGPFAYGY